MYVIMKQGKYFTGDVTPHASFDLMCWSRHPASAKVWKAKPAWAQKTADKWGGTVMRLSEEEHKVDEMRTPP